MSIFKIFKIGYRGYEVLLDFFTFFVNFNTLLIIDLKVSLDGVY